MRCNSYIKKKKKNCHNSQFWHISIKCSGTYNIINAQSTLHCFSLTHTLTRSSHAKRWPDPPGVSRAAYLSFNQTLMVLIASQIIQRFIHLSTTKRQIKTLDITSLQLWQNGTIHSHTLLLTTARYVHKSSAQYVTKQQTSQPCSLWDWTSTVGPCILRWLRSALDSVRQTAVISHLRTRWTLDRGRGLSQRCAFRNTCSCSWTHCAIWVTTITPGLHQLCGKKNCSRACFPNTERRYRN